MSKIEEYYNIATAEDLVKKRINESVFDSGDIGHPTKDAIYHDIDVDLENRNKEPINDRSIEAVKENDSAEKFIQKHIDIVKHDIGNDLELEPTDLNLVFRSISSDPQYKLYDITKKDINKVLKKTINESNTKNIEDYIVEQNTIMGYNYNDLKPLIITNGKNRYINIRKNNTLIEGKILDYTSYNILFEYKNRKYNIVK